MKNLLIKIIFCCGFVPYLLSGCLQSCKTVKYIDRVKTVVDSSVIEQNLGLQRALQETIETYEKEKEQWNSTGVVFDTKCDTVYKTRIEFDNGKLKNIEGNVKSLNQSLFEKQSELYDAYRLIDSLSFEAEKKDTRVVKETVTITKNVKTKVMVWWPWLVVGLIAGLILESRFKILYHLKTIFYQLKFPPL